MAIRPTHLRIALKAADAAADPVAGAIETALPAYCAGALSPDGHGNRAVPRAQTHFYEFRDPATWGLATRRLFEAHPELALPDPQNSAQTAYVAGYLAHLAVDEVFAAVLGKHAIEPDGRAIRGLAWAVEDGWPAHDQTLARADRALGQFSPDGIVTIVRVDHLLDFIARTRAMAGVGSLGELRYVMSRAAGRDVTRAQSERDARQAAAEGRRLFGADIRRQFAARAQAEVEVRLAAYAAGQAARYDAPSFRLGFAQGSC